MALHVLTLFDYSYTFRRPALVGTALLTRSLIVKFAQLATVLALTLSISSTLSAQTEAATLRGSVRDSSQGAVAGASIKLTYLDQNRSWTATSNAGGSYDIEQIPPGRYSLVVEAKGFKRYEQPGLTLQANQVAAIDATLRGSAR